MLLGYRFEIRVSYINHDGPIEFVIHPERVIKDWQAARFAAREYGTQGYWSDEDEFIPPSIINRVFIREVRS